MSYSYDAAGNKLTRISNGFATQYADGIQYKADGTIDFIQHEAGIARRNGSSYSYEYTLTDHLGNARYSFDVFGGAVRRIQQQDYYAFGKVAPGQYVSGEKNKYLYNSKELQEELGQLDYGARFYDPVIARWNVVDPLEEQMRRYSPYNYVFNNPMSFVDPDGMMPMGSGDPRSWLQRLMDFFGVSTSRPKSIEEAIDKDEGQERLGRLEARNKEIEKNLDRVEYFPGGAIYTFSKGVSKRDNTLVAQALGSGVVDLVGGKAITLVGGPVLKGVLRQAVNGSSHLKKYCQDGKVSIDIEHIASGHIKGGNRVSELKTLFPERMNMNDVNKAVRDAYKNIHSKLQTQGDRILLRGTTSQGLEVEMWINKATKTIETAYPIY